MSHDPLVTELVLWYKQDPSNAYLMGLDDFYLLLAEVGEEEPVLDAIMLLSGAPRAERAGVLGL